MDRVLVANSVALGSAGLAAALLPARLGWIAYHNEGCKYFQLHTRVLGATAVAFAVVNLTHARGQTPRHLKATLAQLMLGLSASVVALAALNFSLFTPVIGICVIGTNVLLAGANGYHGFLERSESQ